MYENVATLPEGGKMIKLEKGNCFYRIDGTNNKGPLIIMLHGFLGCHLDYEPLCKVLLSKGRRILRVDNYGRGWSSLPDSVVELSDVDLYASQTNQLLTALNEEGPFDVIGYSMGGGIAARLCTLLGKRRVRSLSLLAPAGTRSTGGAYAELFVNLYCFWEKIARIPILSVVHNWMLEYFINKWFSNISYHGSEDEMMKLYLWYTPMMKKRAASEKQLPCALSATLIGYPFNRLQNIYKEVAILNIPTISIWGDMDSEVPIDCAGELREIFSEAKLKDVTLTGATHMFPIEYPEVVSKTIYKFWETLK